MKHLLHEEYKACLMKGKTIYKKQNVIRTQKHDLYTVEINKLALSPFDDKRYVMNDGIETLPYGHYKIDR